MLLGTKTAKFSFLKTKTLHIFIKECKLAVASITVSCIGRVVCTLNLIALRKAKIVYNCNRVKCTNCFTSDEVRMYISNRKVENYMFMLINIKTKGLCEKGKGKIICIC